MAIKGFAKAQETITEAVERLTAKSVERTFKRIESAMERLQLKLFNYLAYRAGVFGANQSPTFPDISPLPQPSFKELSPDYAKRKNSRSKNKQFGKLGTPIYAGERFFVNTGALQKYMARQNAITKFGKPLVLYRRKGKGRSSETLLSHSGSNTVSLFKREVNLGSKAKKFIPTQDLGTISVDLFPRIQGPIKGESNTGRFMISGGLTSGLFSRINSYKLDNFQGKRDRVFLPQFIMWWIRVQGKGALRKAVA